MKIVCSIALPVALALTPIGFGCGDEKAASSGAAADKAEPAPATDKPSPAAEVKTPAAPAPKAPAPSFDCASYITPAEVEAVCGTKVVFDDKLVKASSEECLIGTSRRGTEGKFYFRISKVFGQERNGFGPTAKVVDKTKGKALRFVAGATRGGYVVTLESRQVAKTDPAPCTSEQLLALTAKVAPKVSEHGTLPKQASANPLCDKALSAEAIKKICGASVRLRPHIMESAESGTCNRGGGEVIFMASKQKNAALAEKAAKYATDNPSPTMHHIAIASGQYVIETKTGKSSVCGTKAKAAALAAKAAETIR